MLLSSRPPLRMHRRRTPHWQRGQQRLRKRRQRRLLQSRSRRRRRRSRPRPTKPPKANPFPYARASYQAFDSHCHFQLICAVHYGEMVNFVYIPLLIDVSGKTLQYYYIHQVIITLLFQLSLSSLVIWGFLRCPSFPECNAFASPPVPGRSLPFHHILCD